MNGLLILGFGVTVIDNATASLNVELFILKHCGSQRDTHVHIAICTEVAAATAVNAAFLRFKFVDDFHRAYFGCP